MPKIVLFAFSVLPSLNFFVLHEDALFHLEKSS
jgi:hypothetical protein